MGSVVPVIQPPRSPARKRIALTTFAEQTNNIARWTEFNRGEHFAAMEEPDLLVADIQTFFHELRERPPTERPASHRVN
jgi:hypothetical protein